jgi:hypothetical protein
MFPDSYTSRYLSFVNKLTGNMPSKNSLILQTFRKFIMNDKSDCLAIGDSDTFLGKLSLTCAEVVLLLGATCLATDH